MTHARAVIVIKCCIAMAGYVALLAASGVLTAGGARAADTTENWVGTWSHTPTNYNMSQPVTPPGAPAPRPAGLCPCCLLTKM